MSDKFKLGIIIAAIALIGVIGFGARRPHAGDPDRVAVTRQPALPLLTTDELPVSLKSPPTQSYVCPMHSHIHSDHAGSKCPICGMELVAEDNVEAESSSQTASEPAPTTTIPASPRPTSEPMAAAETSNADSKLVGAAFTLKPDVRVHLGVRTARVGRGDLARDIKIVGKITRVDASSRSFITAPSAGQLAFIADKGEADPVAAGELLFSVRSDDLIAAQKAFQEVVRAGKLDEVSSMMASLREQGLNPGQIADLQQGAEPKFLAEVYSSEEGTVFERRGELGDNVTTSSTVFSLGGSTRAVEVSAEIFERQWNWVKLDQTAEMTVRGLPGVVFTGKVTRVEPPVGYTTRSLQVQLTFYTENLAVAQSTFTEIRIQGDPKRAVLVVPAEAVIRTEEGDRVVRVNADGRFQSIVVEVGEEATGMAEILSGLSGGEQLVISGQFLIDSESNRLAGLRRLTGD